MLLLQIKCTTAYPIVRSLLMGEVVAGEEHLYRKGDGSLATLALYSSPIYDANGQMIAAVVAVFDITEQKQAQEQIQAALQEKEVLLQEIHDRVKNNLQILNSLLQMQSRRVKSPEAVLALRDTRNRIESIALVHEKLYCSDNLANVDFYQYIPALTLHLFDTYNVSSDTVKIKLQVERLFLEIKIGIPCGLIINELVSNSLKHAFPNNHEGKIQIEFHANSEGLLTLIVRDNGVGLPEDFDLETPHSLGLTLVYELVEQLEGTLDLDRSRGTEFRITFPRTPIQ
ncbi:MAG TPA: histidine kinase dimerization/phosphoacceptor domain -containing protein [Allocoleopsis sp.]